MSDEVYDGAIGIDLGEFLRPIPLPKRKPTRPKLLTELQVPPTLALRTTTVTMSRSVRYHSGAFCSPQLDPAHDSDSHVF